MSDFDESVDYFVRQAEESISQDLARFYGDKAELFPTRQVRFGPSLFASGYICPYCHQDVRLVPYCRPVERVEESRNKLDFDPATVVDANPNRPELGH